jgi:acetyltransferase-like isoleucine patch superfamily enzyme
VQVLTAGKFVRRFLIPSIGVTLILYVRYGAFVSPRAEVELSPLLRVGRKAKVASFSKIKAGSGPLTIGAGTAIATGCFIAAGKAGTHIGDGCLIGANCTIVSNTYRFDDLDVPFFGQGEDSKGTVIGNNVFIGSNSVIADGAVIEDNVMIGAQSLVTGKIPKNSIAQGNPAKVIFTRR